MAMRRTGDNPLADQWWQQVQSYIKSVITRSEWNNYFHIYFYCRSPIGVLQRFYSACRNIGVSKPVLYVHGYCCYALFCGRYVSILDGSYDVLTNVRFIVVSSALEQSNLHSTQYNGTYAPRGSWRYGFNDHNKTIYRQPRALYLRHTFCI